MSLRHTILCILMLSVIAPARGQSSAGSNIVLTRGLSPCASRSVLLITFQDNIVFAWKYDSLNN